SPMPTASHNQFGSPIIVTPATYSAKISPGIHLATVSAMSPNGPPAPSSVALVAATDRSSGVNTGSPIRTDSRPTRHKLISPSRAGRPPSPDRRSAQSCASGGFAGEGSLSATSPGPHGTSPGAHATGTGRRTPGPPPGGQPSATAGPPLPGSISGGRPNPAVTGPRSGHPHGVVTAGNDRSSCRDRSRWYGPSGYPSGPRLSPAASGPASRRRPTRRPGRTPAPAGGRTRRRRPL